LFLPFAYFWKHAGLQIGLSQGQGSNMRRVCATIRCVCRRITAAGLPEVAFWKHPGLQIGLSQGHGSNMGRE